MDDFITAPQFGVNDMSATLVIWHVADGDEVTRGTVVCELETAKASFEVEAPGSGLVLRMVEVGEEAAVGQTLALIGRDRAALDERRSQLRETDNVKQAVTATDKARRMSESLGIDLHDVPSDGGIIRERDVLEFAEQGAGDPMDIRPIGGQLDPALRRAIEDDPDFPTLPSGEKVARYRAAGASIGEDVKFGAGSVINADAIELADGVEISAGTSIAAETIAMGKMSVIGVRSTVHCRHIRIGDMLFTGPEITIGGVNHMSATDKLIIGDLCLIAGHCFLDTGHGIRMGREVGLSPFVKLYTHQHWQNVLEGYRSNFGPIIIQDGAYITGDCLVTPGVTIGAGATVLANSTVASNVGPYTIVSGNPARRTGKVERPLSLQRKERIVKRLIEQMADALEDRIEAGSVVYQQRLDLDNTGGAKVVLTFDAGEDMTISEGVTVFDLGKYQVHGQQTPTSDEVRNFLRRRGIRLAPIHWRYHRP